MFRCPLLRGIVDIVILDGKYRPVDDELVLVLVLILILLLLLRLKIGIGLGKVIRCRDGIEQCTLLPMFMFWAYYSALALCSVQFISLPDRTGMN